MMAGRDMLPEILRLPAEERARLALELLRSLDETPEVDVDLADAWDTELDARSAEVATGTAPTLTLAEYRAHVHQRRAIRRAR